MIDLTTQYFYQYYVCIEVPFYKNFSYTIIAILYEFYIAFSINKVIIIIIIFERCHEKTCFVHMQNKGQDQPSGDCTAGWSVPLFTLHR